MFFIMQGEFTIQCWAELTKSDLLLSSYPKGKKFSLSTLGSQAFYECPLLSQGSYFLLPCQDFHKRIGIRIVEYFCAYWVQ